MKKFIPCRILSIIIGCFFILNSAKANAAVPCFISITDTTVSIACGDSFLFGGMVYKYSVTKTDTFTSTHGCDSIVTLHLNVTDTINITEAVCAGDSFQFFNGWVDTAGVYSTIRPGNNQCDSLVVLTLTVNPLPVVTFTWDSLAALNDVYYYNNLDSALWCYPIFPNVFVLYGGNPSGGHYSGPGVSNDTLYPEQAFGFVGSYDTITYTYSDKNQCARSASGILVYIFCDGISEIDNLSSLQVYPNPATDYITVEYNDLSDNSKIEVLDMIGRVIKTQAIASGTTKTEVDTRNLSNGLYFLRLESGGMMRGETKFNIVR